jgi:CheY-like chemotaxis protein
MGAHSGKILLAEDEESVRHVVRAFLELCGYEVAIAADGREALEAYRCEQPDLLISDVDMPRMSGIELTEEIRRQGSDLPVILISGRLRASELAENDANLGFLQKPFDWSELRTAIRSALMGKPLEMPA